MRTLDEAVKQGYTVEEVDAVFGPATGRPKSAVFRTADVVGLDTLVHVTRNCADALPDDERREVFVPPPILTTLVEKKWLGAKTKQGFYKKVGNDILQLDLKTLEYGPLKKPRFDSIGATKRGRRRRREAAPHGGRHRSRLRPGPHRPLRDPHLCGQPPGRDCRQRRRHRSGAALGFRLGARAVRDLGRPRRQGDLREDGGGWLHRPRLGPRADLRPGRRDEVLSHGRARQARAARDTRRIHAGRRESPPPLAGRHPRRRRRSGAQRKRLAARPRRWRVLPRVPRQDERHRPRHRQHDDEGGRQGRA